VVQADGTPFPKPVDGGLTPVPQRTAEMDIVEQPLDNPEETSAMQPGTSGPDEFAETSPEMNLNENFEIFVQVASFTNEENAKNLAGQLRGVGPVVIQPAEVGSNWFYRVRVGAYGVMEDALAALERIKNLGFLDAHIFTEPVG